jgi:acetyl/propionyl-CoA carboxylase alpha subunit
MQQNFFYQSGGQRHAVGVETVDGRYRIRVGEQEYTLSLLRQQGGRLELEMDGRRVIAYVAQKDDLRYLHSGGRHWLLRRVERQARQRPPNSSTTDGVLLAQMPGVITKIAVQTGEHVRKGDTLILLEAMKMELRVVAPLDGTIDALECRVGEVVARGQRLGEMKPEIQAGAPQ